ncbi:MAG TPA: hypothetical protein VMB77_05270 [Syntrophales bacterium]|nr:hypothetical protein [Syntrophales bacterium]
MSAALLILDPEDLTRAPFTADGIPSRFVRENRIVPFCTVTATVRVEERAKRMLP